MISIDKKSLLSALREVRAKALKSDGRIQREFKRECNEALRQFRADLRVAMRWGWKTASASHLHTQFLSCPRLDTPKIDRAIREVEADARGRFTLSRTHPWYEAMMWLPESERPRETACG